MTLTLDMKALREEVENTNYIKKCLNVSEFHELGMSIKPDILDNMNSQELEDFIRRVKHTQAFLCRSLDLMDDSSAKIYLQVDYNKKEVMLGFYGSLEHNDFEVVVYDRSGIDHISKYSLVGITKEDRVFARICKEGRKYLSGKRVCVGCKNKGVEDYWYDLGDVEGRIFAGLYCESCWDEKYREVEKNINYS